MLRQVEIEWKFSLFDKLENDFYYDTTISKTLAILRQTSDLTTIQINAPGYYVPRSLEDFFKFLNENSKALKKVNLKCDSYYKFSWTPQKLHVNFAREMHEGLLEFLPNKCKQLKSVKLYNIIDPQLATQILQASKVLENLETNSDVNELLRNYSFPQIESLKLKNFT